MTEEIQNQNPEGGQSADQQQVQQDQATEQGQQQVQDWEKAYKNLEPEFTRKSQKLKELSGWEKFQEQTGISADQALQQLGVYDTPSQNPYQQPQQFNPQDYVPQHDYSQYQQPQQNFSQYQQPFQPQPQSFNDPRISQMEQQLNQMRRESQAQQLRQKFPQFDEYYSDVINLADQNGMDLESAWGRVMVDRFDDIMGRQKQQVVDNIRQKGSKDLESSGSAGDINDPSAGLSPEELEVAQITGMTPQEYAQAKQGLQIND